MKQFSSPANNSAFSSPFPASIHSYYDGENAEAIVTNNQQDENGGDHSSSSFRHTFDFYDTMIDLLGTTTKNNSQKQESFLFNELYRDDDEISELSFSVIDPPCPSSHNDEYSKCHAVNHVEKRSDVKSRKRDNCSNTPTLLDPLASLSLSAHKDLCYGDYFTTTVTSNFVATKEDQDQQFTKNPAKNRCFDPDLSPYHNDVSYDYSHDERFEKTVISNCSSKRKKTGEQQQQDDSQTDKRLDRKKNNNHSRSDFHFSSFCSLPKLKKRRTT